MFGYYQYASAQRILLICCLLPAGCAAPRSVTEGGRVTPHKDIRSGMNYSLNVATQTSEYLFDGLADAVEAALGQEVPVYDVQLANLSRAAVAYSLDPVGSGMDLWIRYGIAERFDMGYKFASGVHVLDGRFQFLGVVGDVAESYDGMSGSFGVQYSQQTHGLPGPLGDLQKLLGYDAKRKDVLLPVTLSHAFGPNQRYGAISYGVAVNYTMLNYGFSPIKDIQRVIPGEVDTTVLDPIHGEGSYWAFGAFFNLRLGYRFAYGVLSTAIYHQDYGTFKLPDGGNVVLNGWTIVPTIGLEGHF